MAHQRSNGKYKQDRPAFKWQGKGTYSLTKSAEAAAYVAKCQQRKLEADLKRMARYAVVPALPIASDTDWAAFPPATSPYAPKMAGLAKGLDSAVVYKPITDSARLIEAASRIGRAA